MWIHLLFTEASSEMVSMEGWLSRSHSLRREAMPNDTIRGNKSYGGMNPPQSPDLNITEAVWDHLDREQTKRQPTTKEELWDVLQEAWRTIPEDDLKK